MGAERSYSRAAGIDLGKRGLSVCIRTVGGRGAVKLEEAVYTTMTSQILALRDRLEAARVQIVVMEATGDYWRPVFWILSGTLPGVQVLLVNPAHVRILKGRKTDRRDAAFLARQAAAGNLAGSFIPPEPVREVRDLTRRRTGFTTARASEINRLEKTLEDTGIKITSVISDITGATGRRILAALIAGKRDPRALAALADARIRASAAELAEALTGRFTSHHGYLVADHLEEIDHYTGKILALDARIAELLDSDDQRRDIANLSTIPGIDTLGAQIIVSELGHDMAAFPSPGHLASWLGTTGGHNESAGVKRKTRPADGNTAMRRILGVAAFSVMGHKGTYLNARYHRLRGRMDSRKAQVAIMHDMAIAIWFILHDKVPYRELGADYFIRRDPAKIRRRIAALAHSIGATVDIHDQPTPATT
ncbi:IS110 family transposase [Catenulispora pinisilvae]|uniref:IS110 family transposase n=1 Tax=Catenulispora pinisilvae TaxID=2705253 RepID=UPI001891FA3D|nr:IS110 family transposase [Catenulispora pinisilvae]